MFGDNDAQLVAGDVAAAHETPAKGRPCLAFDDTEEEAAITGEYSMPGQFAGGTLKATIEVYMKSDNTNDIAYDVFVEAKTPDTDTIDLEADESWDTANAGTISLAGSTAGDPLTIEITLTNKDSVAAGDLVRFGIRRDTDSGDDDASGDACVTALEIWEDTA